MAVHLTPQGEKRTFWPQKAFPQAKNTATLSKVPLIAREKNRNDEYLEMNMNRNGENPPGTPREPSGFSGSIGKDAR